MGYTTATCLIIAQLHELVLLNAAGRIESEQRCSVPVRKDGRFDIGGDNECGQRKLTARTPSSQTTRSKHMTVRLMMIQAGTTAIFQCVHPASPLWKLLEPAHRPFVCICLCSPTRLRRQGHEDVWMDYCGGFPPGSWCVTGPHQGHGVHTCI
ncbi:hypothetical protein CONLIGDRAFT_375178 [Coniochaeta ligniaria NRRL 30616]|uniref:Secreted protein n=1 Tax=Coniochaeta ligniaria NRRL 30616 TaxID=1408157 RepID=A0A1J7J525_9PEZI|nr:hypothetical protein CONLIGDRAFT_375178 [Coniochaeta ligniaria NRRL 30616]